ncbi:MAG: hypothetical protein R3E58_19020 [Phycisphaerae bacterium]
MFVIDPEGKVAASAGSADAVKQRDKTAQFGRLTQLTASRMLNRKCTPKTGPQSQVAPINGYIGVSLDLSNRAGIDRETCQKVKADCGAALI